MFIYIYFENVYENVCLIKKGLRLFILNFIVASFSQISQIVEKKIAFCQVLIENGLFSATTSSSSSPIGPSFGTILENPKLFSRI